jgi:hypothetical protein
MRSAKQDGFFRFYGSMLVMLYREVRDIIRSGQHKGGG